MWKFVKKDGVISLENGRVNKCFKKGGVESVVFRYGFNRSFTVPIERTKETNELNDHEKEIFVKNWNESNKSLYSKQYICDTAKNRKPIYKKEIPKGLTFEEIIKKVVNA